MGQEGERDGPGPVWERALERFDRELNARGMSPNTRRAYGVDLDQFAAWANDRGLSPEAIQYRELRGYAAALSDRGLARATVARKLAAVLEPVRASRGRGGGSPESGRAAP